MKAGIKEVEKTKEYRAANVRACIVCVEKYDFLLYLESDAN